MTRREAFVGSDGSVTVVCRDNPGARARFYWESGDDSESGEWKAGEFSPVAWDTCSHCEGRTHGGMHPACRAQAEGRVWGSARCAECDGQGTPVRPLTRKGMHADCARRVHERSAASIRTNAELAVAHARRLIRHAWRAGVRLTLEQAMAAHAAPAGYSLRVTDIDGKPSRSLDPGSRAARSSFRVRVSTRANAWRVTGPLPLP